MQPIQFLSTTPLAAGASVNTGWVSIDNIAAVLYAIRSDVASATGGVVVEYSDDGTNPTPAGLTSSYTVVSMLLQSAFVPKGHFFRLTYTNGATAQTSFRIEVRISAEPVQPSYTSINRTITPTLLATITKGTIELPDATAENATYGQVTRTGTSQNVHVDNQPTSQVVSGSVSVSNFPTSQNVGNFPTTQGVNLSQVGTTAVTLGQKASTVSIPVVVSSDQSVIPVRTDKAPTATTTSVSVLATTTTVLASNTNRKGATVFSEGIIYLLLGAGASQTNYTIKMSTGSYYEIPFSYTGIITATGTVVAVRVTELT